MKKILSMKPLHFGKKLLHRFLKLLLNRKREHDPQKNVKIDYAYWKSIKNKHKGKRGFVIGNGPSLKMKDLEKLKNEITIASNKIYLAFDEVSWRPTYYTIVDAVLLPKIKNDITKEFEIIHASQISFANLKSKNFSSKFKIFSFLGECLSPFKGKYNFSGDMSNGTYGGHTVVYDNLQLAVHLGLNPIYIIGCDHSYAQPKNIQEGVVVEVKDEENHFIKGYRSKGEKVNPAPIEKMTDAYKNAKAFADDNNIKIFNATRGGKLEVFPRANFDELF